MMNTHINDLQEQLARVCAERDALKEALEWALDCAYTEHPHYPYREDGVWVYPYLVHGTPMGGGVGLARFDTAFEAVTAARALGDS